MQQEGPSITGVAVIVVIRTLQSREICGSQTRRQDEITCEWRAYQRKTSASTSAQMCFRMQQMSLNHLGEKAAEQNPFHMRRKWHRRTIIREIAASFFTSIQHALNIIVFAHKTCLSVPLGRINRRHQSRIPLQRTTIPALQHCKMELTQGIRARPLFKGTQSRPFNTA